MQVLLLHYSDIIFIITQSAPTNLRAVLTSWMSAAASALVRAVILSTAAAVAVAAVEHHDGEE